ncbi:MAG: hypothetical protein WDN69_34820 [Aliidongia sp.]
MQGPENKNLFLAIALCLVILVGWDFLMPKKAPPPSAPVEQSQQQAGAAPGATVAPTEEPKLSRDDALQASQRVIIDTPERQGARSTSAARASTI